MMGQATLVALLAAGAVCVALVLRASLARRAVLSRLREPADDGGREPLPPSSFGRRTLGVNRALWVGMVVGVAALFVFLGPLGIPREFAFAGAFIVGSIAFVIADIRAARFAARLETQLADAIDLMISSLRAGSGWSDALENAVREVRRPLRPVLETALGRLRYGESPAVVLGDLSDQVRLESFWLFSLTQQVQQGVGGSVAKGLAAVGRFIRDRVEMRRMLSSQSTMARLSMLFVTVLTYLIGAVIWFNNPDRVRLFLEGEIGRSVAAGAMILQAVGVIWITRLSQVRQ